MISKRRTQMIKRFCDNCDCEITPSNPDVVSSRIEFRVKRYRLVVVVSTDGTWNGGALCLSCAKQLIPEALKRGPAGKN
jgi:hypothetical protein